MDPVVELEWYKDEVDRLNAELAEYRRRSDNRKKLTAKEAATIRDMVRSGYSQRAVAAIYDVAPATVSRLVRGIYWRTA